MGNRQSANEPEAGLFESASPLSPLERTLLLTVVCVVFVAGVVMHLVSGDDVLTVAYESSLTIALAGFAFAPGIAAAVCLLLVFGGFFTDAGSLALVVGALALALVVRTGRRHLVLLYASFWLVALCAQTMLAGEQLGQLIVLAVIGAVCAASGYILRVVEARSRLLGEKLEERAQSERDLIAAERLRIADELHDVVAHDLTIIAMHVHLLADAPGSAGSASLDAIRDSSQRALDDLRRVVGESHLRSANEAHAVESEFRSAVLEGRVTLQRAGMIVEDDLAALEALHLPRIVDRTMSRIVREGVTNALKHGSRGRVTLRVSAQQGDLDFVISNPVAPRRASRLPSGGYGLVRMDARVSNLGGSMLAASHAGTWTMRVRVPIG